MKEKIDMWDDGECLYVYAYVHVTMDDGEKHKFTMKNDTELGATLNCIQGAIFSGKAVESYVEPIAEESKFKAECYNKIGGTLEKQEKVSRIIRGIDDETKI